MSLVSLHLLHLCGIQNSDHTAWHQIVCCRAFYIDCVCGTAAQSMPNAFGVNALLDVYKHNPDMSWLLWHLCFLILEVRPRHDLHLWPTGFMSWWHWRRTESQTSALLFLRIILVGGQWRLQEDKPLSITCFCAGSIKPVRLMADQDGTVVLLKLWNTSTVAQSLEKKCSDVWKIQNSQRYQ